MTLRVFSYLKNKRTRIAQAQCGIFGSRKVEQLGCENDKISGATESRFSHSASHCILASSLIVSGLLHKGENMAMGSDELYILML